MAESGFSVQNQLKFNLAVPLSAANIAVRYHKPNPIVIERAGVVADRAPHHGPISRSPGESSMNLSNISEDRLSLAVQLAKRDVKRRKEQGLLGDHPSSKSTSPSRARKPGRPLVSKGGTKIIHTKECKERVERLEEKRGRDPLRVREQGWNSGTSVARTQTPPRDRRRNLPVTTNSPPTRDTDNYPTQRSAPLVDPHQEIGRLQKEIEGYLQQIQVIEQRAMTDQPGESVQPSKSRKKDGYLSDEEDPARKVLRQEEQATRAARQIYFLRQQVRSLQEHVTRVGPEKVKHTKKSQTMLRLAAAHRGAVRAIQGFVNQQLPLQDLRRGLPTGYHELALLIRQLALVSTQIKADKDTSEVHEDLLKMLDRVDELNKGWCSELAAHSESTQGGMEGERRRKSPQGRQPEVEVQRGRQLQPRRTGKENRPKGLLKKQYNKQTKSRQQESRKLTPERQNILRAGLEALVREDPSLRQRSSGMAWNVPMETSMISEPANTSLILPKHLQHKREKAQKSVPLAVPETHFTDPTVSFNLKTVHLDESMSSPSREPWRPGGSVGKSPSRQPRSRSAERSRSQDRSRSKSPRSSRHVVISDVDQELISELFPNRDRRQRPRSASPGSPRRQRSRSPPILRGGRGFSHSARGRLGQLHKGAKDVSMARDRQRETAEISLRQMLADRAIEKAGVSGEVLSDMILHDLLRDTAEELESLEDTEEAKREATAMHHNPTLENMYQRLEQMELEQTDIRRRWGTLQFEEESSRRHIQHPERPAGPVAMEITRERPSQSHRVQNTRSFDKEADEPIIFTKSAPAPKFQQRTTPLVEDENHSEDIFRQTQRGPPRIRLKVPESIVRDVKNNLEKYERHLKKTQHENEGRFDPWKLVEEISDQVLEECLREIDSELDEIGEGLVHQVCKSEFSVPEPSEVAEQLAAEARLKIAEHVPERREIISERTDHVSELIDQISERIEHSSQRREQVSEILDQVSERRDFSERRDPFLERREQMSERTEPNHERSVRFEDDIKHYQELLPEYEMGYNLEDETPRGERIETLADIEELQPVDVDSETEINTEIQSERVGRVNDQSISQSEIRDNEYDDDEYEDDDDDDDDDVEEVSPIDSDDLEYSTDET